MKKFTRFLVIAALWPSVLAMAALQAQSAPSAASAPDEQTTALRRLDETPADASKEQPAAEPTEPQSDDEDAAPSKEPPPPVRKSSRHLRHDGGRAQRDDDRVSVFSNTHVDADETVRGGAVAVMGDVQVDGTVEEDAVAVMGNNTVNGTVRGNAVAVFGDVTLGPKAHVAGDVVSVGGAVVRDPTAIVEGKIVQQAIGKTLHVGVPVTAWWTLALGRGRPLAVGQHLAWLWVATAIALAFYVLLALAFPRGLRRCGDLIVERPGLTVLTAILSIIALPIVFVLLLVTIIGIPVAFIALPAGVLLAVLFGKASIYALLGRGLTSGKAHPALAVLLGAGVFLLLYLVPLLGLGLSFLVAMIGFGSVVLALITPNRKPVAPSSGAGSPAGGPVIVPPPPAAAAVVAPPAMVVEPPVPAAAEAVAGSPEVPAENGPIPPPVMPAEPPRMATEPPPIAAIALPRVGFWLRTAAMLIDLVLVAVIIALLHGSGPVVILLLAAYGAVMWKLKSTTVGGIVCGIKVVRLDARPIDWPTAVVRALGCFLSLIVAGLGFVWVAFDDEKQGWHDKIAGTTVVKMPKGESLV